MATIRQVQRVPNGVIWLDAFRRHIQTFYSVQRPPYTTYLQRPWRHIREIVGLANARIHDMRHTYASNAFSPGMPIQMVGRLLGHTQIQTTMRYTHLADDPVRRCRTYRS
ncbi:tyrosine-type recombinase/integrase [Falsihalocynthiibacter arcticus]|uniref:tyrosine-type recombinase/integrase n=1 Tax=Falsihalocynthiibacter arcticus TaxID=1579316 RepID=UPI001EEF6B3B|nr:tyrosine-type recombinase/integrase [Falsihalocynthiibacter arcticus]